MRRRLRIGWVIALIVVGCSGSPDAPKEPSESHVGIQSSVAEDAYAIRPLLPGMMAPSFSTRDAENTIYSFEPGQLDNPVIIAFYRGGWCPYCNLQLSELRDLDDELVELGYELLFLSADRPAKLAEGSIEEDPPFRLLSDSTMSIAADFGIAFQVADETVDRYLGAGIDLADASGADHQILPVPAVFIVGSDGELKFQYANPNYRERIPGALLLGAARVFAEGMP